MHHQENKHKNRAKISYCKNKLLEVRQHIVTSYDWGGVILCSRRNANSELPGGDSVNGCL